MENFSASAGITCGMKEQIFSRLTFPAPAAAPLNIASSSAFLTRVSAVFQTVHNFVIVLTKTKYVLQWNSKRKCTFDGW